MSTHPDPEQLSAYVDGELTGTDRDDLEQHLTGCSQCSATLRSLRATLADMRALPSPAPSEQESWALRAAITKARRKPAERYRRWVIAASGVAAVAVAVVVISTTGTSTKKPEASSSKGTLDAGPVLGAIPGLATPPTPSIEIDPRNYTSHSAKDLLASFLFAVAAPAQVQSPSTSAGTGHRGTSSAGSTQAQNGLATTSQQSRYLPQIQRCERIVLSKDTGSARPIAYIVGRYDSTPAFFLIYTVTVSGKSKTEMWVVQQKDCYIRLFLAPQ